MKKKKAQREKEGYTSEEMRALTRGMIDKMIVRLQKRLQEEREKQKRRGRVRHGVIV